MGSIALNLGTTQKTLDKYSLIGHGMSSGKTAQTIIRAFKADSFIWITSNEALSLGVFARLGEYIDNTNISSEQKVIEKTAIAHYTVETFLSFEKCSKSEKIVHLATKKKCLCV